MIDEQHPMQIGLFPMDIKCHTAHQLQIQQQQQQQPHTSLLMNGNGNAGMLTASTTATTTSLVTPNGNRNGKGAQTASTTAAVAMTTATPAQTTAQTAVATTIASSVTVQQQQTTAMQRATAATLDPSSIANVNGCCNNSNNNNNDKTNISANGDGVGAGPGPGPPSPLPLSTQQPISRAITASQQQQQQQQQQQCCNTMLGHPANALTSVSRCVLLGECNGDATCEPLCIAAADSLSANNNNRNSNNKNNHIHSNELPLGMQPQPLQMLSHQQQHQLQHPHDHHHHHRHHHSHSAMVMLASNNNNNNTNNDNNNNCCPTSAGDVLSLQLSSPCGALHRTGVLNMENGGGGGCGAIGVSHIISAASIALTQCGYCCQPICDRYIMRVVDTSFHEGCLKCAICSLNLAHSCFARDGKLYCRIDYERLFIRNRCLGCGHKIASDELVMRTLENVFHLKCFACVVCGAVLKKGEQYVVKQGQLFCRFDYEKEVEMLQGYDFYGDDLFPPKLDGRRGPKRPRTILNTQQRRAFKASFEVSPKPCRKVRENLAKETGLSLRIVQVWFQNQRAKVKKIQKKAKQEHVKGTSDSQDSQESDSSLAKVKDEAHSDSESLLESPYSSCGGGGSGNNSVANIASSLPDGINKLRCIKDENEDAPFHCMETNKENCNKTNEPILNTILGLSYATFQQLMGPFTQSPMVNPIDRLYSMQNSYFRPEELNYTDCGKEIAEN